MKIKPFASRNDIVPAVIRKILLSWLSAVTIEYALLPVQLKDLQSLTGLAQMSLFRILLLTAAFLIFFLILNRPQWERWLIPTVFAALSAVSLCCVFSFEYLIACLLILLCLTVYAILGWNNSSMTTVTQKESSACVWLTVILAAAFFVLVSIWTVCRVYSFSTPTYDFGIFSQMFYNMKQTGLPFTTVERDGLLSHFHVHMSPVYYLLLPLYYIAPTPATLQVLQAAVLSSAVIPLWLIGKHHGLSPIVRLLLSALLLFYPAYSGGTSYDIHENAFLTPLIFWLFFSLDKKNFSLLVFFSILLLSVKEDAAVYAAVIAIYYLLNGLLRNDRWERTAGIFLLLFSILWFLAVTTFLSNVGDGVMTYRYSNFIYDDSNSLITVLKSVIMCPMKVVFECVDPDKLSFIGITLLPIAALPFFTRRYERYILLIPYVLINLMSDYQYQHNIFFQYTFGSIGCLFYMTAVNLADLNFDFKRTVALAVALSLSVFCFVGTVLPKAVYYPKKCIANAETLSEIRQTLSKIPDGADVSATTFYTTFLSQRSVLYDIQYASTDHLLSTQYVVLAYNSESSYKKYAKNGKTGFENLTDLLLENGYAEFAELEDTLIIYQKKH